MLVGETPAGTIVGFQPIAPTLLNAGVPESLIHRLDRAQDILREALQP